MKLYDYLNREYAVILTEYGCNAETVSDDMDEYNIQQIGSAKARELSESVIDSIKANAIYDPDEVIDVWKGTVSSVAGIEDVTVYVPETWD